MELNEGISIARSLKLIIYDHNFGNGSYKNLDGVLPRVVTVAELAIKLCEYDGTVIANGGLRSQAAADANAASGKGISTSRHLTKSDGYGHAIDVIPLVPGRGIVWDNLTSHRAMAKAVKIASAILSVPIRQGADWNMNGVFGEPKEYDWDHFEDPKTLYQEAARAEMLRYRRVLGLDNLQDIPELEGDEDALRGLSECACPHCGELVKMV